MSLHVLSNAETWTTTRDGRTIRYEDMSPSHRVNTLRMLLRKAPFLTLGYWAVLGEPNGDMAALALELEQDESARDPHGWVLNTPAGRRLLELIQRDGYEVLL